VLGFGGVACSVIPDLDLDVIGFHFGIHYGDFWGHRGFTHSLLFAVLLASVVTAVMVWRGISGIGRFALFGYLSLATASHGLLDSITNGGLGVGFFSPFNNRRYFLPWTPVRVSPIAVTRFFTHEDLPSLRVNL
jgi:inner membrane protein